MSDELKKLLEGLNIKVLDTGRAEIDGGIYVRSQIKHWADNAGGTGQRLGWRTLLLLMDEYEEPKKPEPKPTLMENSARSSFSPPRCEKHNRQMVLAWYDRPGSPPGNGWYCPECANKRESKAAEKPTWEPGMLVEHFDENGNRTQFLVEAVGGRYLHDRHGSSYFIGNCRHVPASRKEAIAELARQEMADGHYVCDPVKPQDPFTGAHWDAIRKAAAKSSCAEYQCLCDLADEVRRLREGK